MKRTSHNVRTAPRTQSRAVVHAGGADPLLYLCLLAVLLALSTLLPSAVAAPASAAPPASPDFAEIDAFVQTSMRESGIPGVALGVVRGDQVVHLHGFGVADPSGRPVTPQTPFRIGSNTKSFTALAIMQLAEQGRIDVEAPVQRYLPWFRLADPDAAAQITVSQLMYMTSGIPGVALYESFGQSSLTLDQYGRALATVQPNRPVGSSFEYSNANYNLLGLIVEAVSGQAYADYVQQHILTPLEMHQTAATPADEQRNGLGPGYQWWFGLGPFPADDPFSQANLPTGYLTSTVEDMAHYQIAQLSGGRYRSAQILSGEGITRMHQTGPNAVDATHADRQYGFGMGWGTKVVGDRSTLFYNGETFGFVSHQTIDPRNGWGVVILTNATNQFPSRDAPFHSLVNGVLARLDPSAAPSIPTGMSVSTWYLIVDAVLVLISAWLVRSLVHLPRWSARFEARLGDGLGRVGLVLAGLRVGLEVGLALIVLWLPPLLGIGWPIALLLANDLTPWALIAAISLLATGLLRGGLLLRGLHRRRQQPQTLAGAL